MSKFLKNIICVLCPLLFFQLFFLIHTLVNYVYFSCYHTKVQIFIQFFVFLNAFYQLHDAAYPLALQAKLPT